MVWNAGLCLITFPGWQMQDALGDWVGHLEAAQNDPACPNVRAPNAPPPPDDLVAVLNLLRTVKERLHIVILLRVGLLQAAQRIHLLLEPETPCTRQSMISSSDR